MRFTLASTIGVALMVTIFGGGVSGLSQTAVKDKAVNLLQNGSFEFGPDPGDFKSFDEDSTDIKGWIVTRGQIDYLGAFCKAAHGNRCIDLHGSPGFGGVKQAFATKKGQSYRVTLSLAGSPFSAGEKKVGVRAAGIKTAFTVDGTGTTKEAPGWVIKTWEFVATADLTTLEIHTLETTDNLAGPLLDNVSVVAIDKKVKR